MDAFACGDFVSETVVEIVNQSRHCAGIDAAVFEERAEVFAPAMVERCLPVGIALEVAARQEGAALFCVERHAVPFAEGAQFIDPMRQGRIYAQVDNGVCVPAGVPEVLIGFGQKKAVGDEAQIGLWKDGPCGGDKRSGIRMQEGFAAHEPNLTNVSKKLLQPAEIAFVPADVRVMRRGNGAVVTAPFAVEVAVICQMQLHVMQDRLRAGQARADRFF